MPDTRIENEGIPEMWGDMGNLVGYPTMYIAFPCTKILFDKVFDVQLNYTVIEQAAAERTPDTSLASVCG